MLRDQLSKLTRNARTYYLCTKGAMLKSSLSNPKLLTEDEVMAVSKIAFYQPNMKNVLEKMVAESEVRESLTE